MYTAGDEIHVVFPQELVIELAVWALANKILIYINFQQL